MRRAAGTGHLTGLPGLRQGTRASDLRLRDRVEIGLLVRVRAGNVLIALELNELDGLLVVVDLLEQRLGVDRLDLRACRLDHADQVAEVVEGVVHEPEVALEDGRDGADVEVRADRRAGRAERVVREVVEAGLDVVEQRLAVLEQEREGVVPVEGGAVEVVLQQLEVLDEVDVQLGHVEHVLVQHVQAEVRVHQDRLRAEVDVDLRVVVAQRAEQRRVDLLEDQEGLFKTDLQVVHHLLEREGLEEVPLLLAKRLLVLRPLDLELQRQGLGVHGAEPLEGLLDLFVETSELGHEVGGVLGVDFEDVGLLAAVLGNGRADRVGVAAVLYQALQEVGIHQGLLAETRAQGLPR